MTNIIWVCLNMMYTSHFITIQSGWVKPMLTSRKKQIHPKRHCIVVRWLLIYIPVLSPLLAGENPCVSCFFWTYLEDNSTTRKWFNSHKLVHQLMG